MALLDVILGDTFLRNTYALYNFGNWTRPGDSGPYIQVLGVRIFSFPPIYRGRGADHGNTYRRQMRRRHGLNSTPSTLRV